MEDHWDVGHPPSLAGALGGVGIADIGDVEAGNLFGTGFGGNTPLFNSNDFLRVGWSYVGDGQYHFGSVANSWRIL